MFRPLGIAVLAALLLSVRAASAAEYRVAPGGNDAWPGSDAQPWATLQHAADTVTAGDTVHVAAGTYDGFDLRTSGAMDAWIVFIAEAGALIDQPNTVTGDGVNLEGVSYVRIEGFTVQGSPGAIRNGFRAVLGQHVVFRDNRSFDNDQRGFLTGFVDDVVFEDNEAAGSLDEHGIYVSNSGDRPIIRGNYLHDNNANGLHMNGDRFAGGDGIISGALVENNVITGNGVGGGSGINGDGVQDALIRNNLVVGNHATGIALYAIDGGDGSKRNTVIHNTVVNDSDGRWGITIRDGSTGNVVLNNVFISRHGYRGAIDVATDSLDGLVSDYNAVEDRMTTNGGDSVTDLAGWRALSGQDQNSFIATEAALFVAPGFPGGDYHLRSDSPARDAGIDTGLAPRDFENGYRPSGSGIDIGAHEFDICTGPGELWLTATTVTTSVDHVACRIVAGPAYRVAAGTLGLLATDRVVLEPGFSVAAGAGLSVGLVP